jgi:hypothetical protein
VGKPLENAEAVAAEQPRATWPPPATRPTFSDAATTFPERPAPQWPAKTDAKSTSSTTAPSDLPVMSDAKIDLISLSLSKQPPNVGSKAFSTRPDLMFKPFGGTVARFMITAPDDKRMLNIYPASIHVTEFADDTGAQLKTTLVNRDTFYANTPAAYINLIPSAFATNFRAFSEDGKLAVVTVALDDAPKPKATRVLIRGELKATIGENPQTAEQKDFALTSGSQIQLGKFYLAVKGLRATGASNEQGETSVGISFETDQWPDYIRSIELIDPDGKKIPVTLSWPRRPVAEQFGGTEPSAEASRPPYRLDGTIYRDVQKCTIRVTYLDRVETMAVPFEMTSGVGL